MEVIKDIKKSDFTRSSVVTVGTFDGIHLGHQQIISVLLDEAEKNDLQPVVITFDPHPQEVVGIKKNNPIKILTSLDEKIELLEKLNVERILVLSFDKKLASMLYTDFVSKILLDKLNMQRMVVGHDHALGKGREGKWDQLQELGQSKGFDLIKVDPFFLNNKRISSTLIRESLEKGDVAETAMMLGRSYRIKGIVVKGDGRGKELNFPTANIKQLDLNIRIPHFGVYAVYVEWQNKKYSGMMNIGNRPTFCCKDMTIEVNIFDFDNTIYNDELAIEFVQWIRSEKKFSGIESLVSQLKKDEENCRKILN